ncbi:MAG: hypothetical protein KGL53_05750, partial [Elusimicrobia bacterium]|nr:hypothetical protein [Elusimicrobiota bacterium]
VQSPSAQGQGLDASFRSLESVFDGRRLAPGSGNSVVPADRARAIVGRMRSRLHGQLDAMLRAEPEDLPLIEQVRTEGDALLSEIDRLMRSGEVDPRARLRLGPDSPRVRPQKRPLRVGVYPVAADPFQWAHLLIGLRAIAAFRLDKVVFVLAGDDPRKPNMTKADFRHPMGRAVLDAFAPFFEYSPIALGTDYDGETNIFRLMALNPDQAMKAFYLVGGDHYRRQDKNGNPDTLGKIEAKLAAPGGRDHGLHDVEVAFIARDGMDEHVPTTLQVHFLPTIPFNASSTLVRGGRHALMPYAAYEYVLRHRPGLYGIGEK